jgi:predicted RNA-binding protein YlxR (DUF448 family)/ribosomal protein L30E
MSASLEDQPRRRCIATGASGDRDRLLRFVLTPDGAVVPDVDEKLPGRGLWVTSTRTALETARRQKSFAKAARAPVRVPDELATLVEELLSRRCRDILGLAARAGQATFGYQKVREWLIAGKAGLLVEASDGAPGDRGKLRALSGGLAVIDVLTAEELGAAVGRERFVHGAITPGKLSDRFAREASRLAGFRTGPGQQTPDHVD